MRRGIRIRDLETDASLPPARSNLRWWRDWLAMSALAVFLLSLLAAHLRQELVPVVILPFAFVSGLAIRKCADIARPPHPQRCTPCVWRQRFAAGCLLLAGLTHVYWVVFDRYRDEAIEANQRRQAEMTREVMAEVADANPAGLSAVFEVSKFVVYL
jgi:hypothetical protein